MISFFKEFCCAVKNNMVITFIVHPNFTVSARCLDSKRLPNQRREAFQILCMIQRIKAMAMLLSLPIPNNPYEWYEWIRVVIKKYKEHSVRTQTQLVKLKSNNWVSVPMSSPVDPKPEVDPVLTIQYGYIYHPVVLMWLGFEDALKDYIDAHIDVSIERGIHNNMIKYQINTTCRPPWTTDPDFLSRHRAVLLKKELERNEPPWYQLNPYFVNDLTPYPKYFWAYTPRIGKLAQKSGQADQEHRYHM
jgi:hypothetical protein